MIEAQLLHAYGRAVDTRRRAGERSGVDARREVYQRIGGRSQEGRAEKRRGDSGEADVRRSECETRADGEASDGVGVREEEEH